MFVQIGINGLISVGEEYKGKTGAQFPIPHRVIAPYWDKINMKMQGRIEYKDYYTSSLQEDQDQILDNPLQQVNDYFEERTDVSFQASRILVVKWVDACSHSDNKCIKESMNVSGYFAQA